MYKKYMEQMATMFPYIEIVSDDDSMRTFYEYLIHIRLDGKWKFLKEIPMAKGNSELKVAYASCALVCRDSLTELDIYNDIIEGYPFSYANKQYNRLVSRLEQFKCLESLQISKTSDERLEDFDFLLDNCNRLTTLDITITKSDSGGTRSIPSIIGFLNIKGWPDITTIRGALVIDDAITIKYIMQKFPKLKSLTICYDEDNNEPMMPYFDDTIIETLIKFIYFLEKINDHVVDIYLSKPITFKLLESIGNKIEYFNICYSWGDQQSNILEGALLLNLLKASAEKRCIRGISLNYGYSDRVLPHLKVLEKFGHALKYLESEGQGLKKNKYQF